MRTTTWLIATALVLIGYPTRGYSQRPIEEAPIIIPEDAMEAGFRRVFIDRPRSYATQSRIPEMDQQLVSSLLTLRSGRARLTRSIDTRSCSWVDPTDPSLPQGVQARIRRLTQGSRTNPTRGNGACLGLVSCQHRTREARVFFSAGCIAVHCSSPQSCVEDSEFLQWLIRQTEARSAGQSAASGPGTDSSSAGQTQ